MKFISNTKLCPNVVHLVQETLHKDIKFALVCVFILFFNAHSFAQYIKFNVSIPSKIEIINSVTPVLELTEFGKDSLFASAVFTIVAEDNKHICASVNTSGLLRNHLGDEVPFKWYFGYLNNGNPLIAGSYNFTNNSFSYKKADKITYIPLTSHTKTYSFVIGNNNQAEQKMKDRQTLFYAHLIVSILCKIPENSNTIYSGYLTLTLEFN